MSTITGVSQTVHIQPPTQDMANEAALSRGADNNFAPVEESNATEQSKNQPTEDPSRDADRRADRDLQADLGKLLKESRLANESRISEESNAPTQSSASLQFGNLSSPPEPIVADRPAQATPPPVASSIEQNAKPETPAVERKVTEERVESRIESRREQVELHNDQQQIAELKQRDREVKDHEQAHKAVGGQYAGAMSLQYERGPDGVNYAVAGEVQINLSRSADNPEADLIKAQQVRQAALAPAEPSAQDRSVAAAATQLALDAQERIRVETRALESKDSEQDEEGSENRLAEEDSVNENSKAEENRAARSAEQSKEHINELLESTKEASARILEVHQIDENRRTLGKLIDFEV